MTAPRIVVRVQAAPFDLGLAFAALVDGRPDLGGVASFIGICRADDSLAAMTLEHYPGMTERAIGAIVAEACARWPLGAVTVIHRHGTLTPGDPIVLVLTASAHRQPALESCAFLMDWLKTRAPFWKRESFADGATRWVAAKAADDAAAAAWTAPAA